MLVLGGSQGAHTLNVALVAAAPRLAAVSGGIRIIHQTASVTATGCVGHTARRACTPGSRRFSKRCTSRCGGGRGGLPRRGDDAGRGRGGRLPAVIVPLPTAAGDHQRRECRRVRRAGAAEVIEEIDLERRLAPRVTALAGDRGRRAAMSRAAVRMARPDAVDRVLRRAEQLMGRDRTVAAGEER